MANIKSMAGIEIWGDKKTNKQKTPSKFFWTLRDLS